MTDFAEFRIRDLRLTLLRALKDAPGNHENETVLLHACDTFGMRVSKEAIRAQMQFLEQSGAITIKQPVAGFFVAQLTQRGLDHVERRLEIPGVNLPSLG